MRKMCVVSFAVLMVSLFIACASTPGQKPLWADYDTIEAAYPKALYIARIGMASSGAKAGVLAEGELATYFTHTVRSESTAQQKMESAAGETTTDSRMIVREVTVESLMNLFAIHRTTPFFDKDRNQYVCCAYIQREEAWKLYESQLFSSRERFFSFYKPAQNEKDPLKKMLLLKRTEDVAAEYRGVLDFARLLSPEKESRYAEDRVMMAQLERDKERAMADSVMRVVVSQDDSNRILRCVTELLAQEGFSLTDRKEKAVYEVHVVVEQNKALHDDMLTAEPGINVSIRSGAGQIFSYGKTCQRVTGFSAAEALVNKKIYAALEQELRSTFLPELRTALAL